MLKQNICNVKTVISKYCIPSIHLFLHNIKTNALKTKC